jgi:hypothetical protein
MTRTILRILFVLFILAGCTPAPGELPTVTPTETQLSATPTWTLLPPSETPSASPTPALPTPTLIEASPTLAPSLTDTPLPLPTQRSSRRATPTSTPVPQPGPDSGAIQIQAPGPLSKVVSPLHLRGYVVPGFNSVARIELFGEDGRVLVRKIERLYTIYKWSYFVEDIPFEVHAAGELGRLTISTQDVYGRTIAMNSVHLLLLAEGDSIINLPDKPEERCLLNLPNSKTQISGGSVKVAGEMRPADPLPLVVELIGQDKSVLSSRLVAVTPTPDDSYVPFSIDVPYSLSRPAWVLLVVRQADDRITGGMYLYSQEFYLRP